MVRPQVCESQQAPGHKSHTLLHARILLKLSFTARYGQPEEVAGMVRFLALDPAALYITGQASWERWDGSWLFDETSALSVLL